MIKTTTMLRRSLLAVLCGLVVTTTGVAPMTAMTVYAEPTDGDDKEGDDGDQGADTGTKDPNQVNLPEHEDDPPAHEDDSKEDENEFRYAVQIYGIKKDTAAINADGEELHTAGLTFGPAIGKSYVGDSSSHTPTAGEESDLGYDLLCVHDLSWDEIIWWNETDPTVFKECVERGCTKTIVLDSVTLGKNAGPAEDDSEYVFTNSIAFSKDDGPSVLYSEIQKPARIWADNHDNDNGSQLSWANSKIRAVLNGAQNETSDIYGGKNYSLTNSIYSVLPQNLKDAIGFKANTYEYGYDGSQTWYNTCYDRLWLLSSTELYGTSLDGYRETQNVDKTGLVNRYYPDNENSQYEDRNSNLRPDHTDATGDEWYESATGYKADGTKANYWLRSAIKSTNIFTEKPGTSAEKTYDERYSYIANVASYGLNNADTHWTYSGIAFGFTLYRETQDPEDPDPTPGTSTSTPSSGESSHGENEGVGSITLYNTDTTVSKYLAGAQFALYKSNGDYVGTYTMDANGYLNIKGVAASTYYFVQLTAPEGYVLDPTYLRFQLKGNQDLSLVFKNALVGSVATNTDGTLADTTTSPNADGTQAVADGADADAAFNVNSDGTNAGTGSANANGDLNGNGVGATGDDSLMTTYGVVAGAAAILLIVWFANRKRRAGQ